MCICLHTNVLHFYRAKEGPLSKISYHKHGFNSSNKTSWIFKWTSGLIKKVNDLYLDWFTSNQMLLKVVKPQNTDQENWFITTQTATDPFAAHKGVASDHQCFESHERSLKTFSRSGKVAHLIIMVWSGSEFQTGNSSIKLQKWSCEVWSCFLVEINGLVLNLGIGSF